MGSACAQTKEEGLSTVTCSIPRLEPGQGIIDLLEDSIYLNFVIYHRPDGLVV